MGNGASSGSRSQNQREVDSQSESTTSSLNFQSETIHILPSYDPLQQQQQQHITSTDDFLLERTCREHEQPPPTEIPPAYEAPAITTNTCPEEPVAIDAKHWGPREVCRSSGSSTSSEPDDPLSFCKGIDQYATSAAVTHSAQRNQILFGNPVSPLLVGVNGAFLPAVTPI